MMYLNTYLFPKHNLRWWDSYGLAERGLEPCVFPVLLSGASSIVILVGCARTAAVLDESMVGGMGDRWDFIIGWLTDLLVV